MGFVPPDLAAIPVHQLAPRRLHLGPFMSGRDVVKFLGVAATGAIVAALSWAVLWLPFLVLGAVVAFVRVEERTLDDYALGYVRFRWRSSGSPRRTTAGARAGAPLAEARTGRPPSIRAGGIPIAYLPPGDLQRLFEEWRSALSALGHPLAGRMRAEPFSPLPFLPDVGRSKGGDHNALESYRELVRTLLRHRYRRVVDLTAWPNRSEPESKTFVLGANHSELVSTLERLGIPTEDTAADDGTPGPTLGGRP